jgi:hypothetical protein
VPFLANSFFSLLKKYCNFYSFIYLLNSLNIGSNDDKRKKKKKKKKLNYKNRNGKKT